MELFTIGGLLIASVMSLAWYFITAIIVLILFASVFSNDDEIGNETWLFLGILGLMGWALWGKVTIGEAVLFTVYYLVIGSAWSIFNYARVIRKNMIIAKADGATAKNYSLKHFRDEIKNDRIARWVLYFPFSIFEYIIGDFFVNIIKKIVSMLGGTYNRIANHYYTRYFG